MEEFIQRVRKIIDEKGLKQKAVAKKMGWTAQRLNNMLCGRGSIMPSEVQALCIALDVEPNELFKRGA